MLKCHVFGASANALWQAEWLSQVQEYRRSFTLQVLNFLINQRAIESVLGKITVAIFQQALVLPHSTYNPDYTEPYGDKNGHSI